MILIVPVTPHAVLGGCCDSAGRSESGFRGCSPTKTLGERLALCCRILAVVSRHDELLGMEITVPSG
jgi:hypothetical protein